MVSDEVLNSLTTRVVTKKEAVRRQIEVAIRIFYEGEYESAITLACAAEGQMEGTEHPHLFTVLNERMPKSFATPKQWATFLNETRDWLKHPTFHLEESRGIAEFEAWVMLVRAVTKYYAVFLEENDIMSDFEEWGKVRGLIT